MEKADTMTLKGKKMSNIYTNIYEVQNTVFSDQMGHFPTRSRRGKKYIMVMVEINRNAILVEPLNSGNDTDPTRSYRTMMLQLKPAGIVPRKDILDNKVSGAMKTIICD